MAVDRLQREFVTSEGIDLRLHLGRVSERAAAFIIDLVIVMVTLFAFTLLAITAVVGSGTKEAAEATGIIWLLGFFVLRNCYFIAFELGMRAATPGKRIMRLRVVARDGGRLTGEAVVARNAMRELEFILPIQMLFAYGDGWLSWIAGLASTGMFLAFPLFNRDNLRVGDLLAGTWVVRQPRAELGHTVGQRRRSAPEFVFTEAQLDAYGEFELQRLEDVLRREDDLSLIVVARAIQRKIDWTGGGEDLDFLQAYYTALCLKLERNMLFGKRRADKHSKA